MTARVDKRLLWHPRQDNKFIVGGGSQITLYEWSSDLTEVRHVTSRSDLHLMKCFAWSPQATFDDLLAIGLSNGRVDLVRLEATKYGRNNIVTTGPTLSLPVRSSRTCNAVAFCSASPNILAVGLDKVRGDSSLIVWDVEAASTVLSYPGAIPDTSDTILKPPGTKIPRSVPVSKLDPTVVQQYAPAEALSSVSFLPQSKHLLMAGVSQRWLRLFDLRHPGTSAPQSVASRVQGIATDPFDQHRVACFGDSVVTIWDGRKLVHPLLTFTEKDASADGARYHPNNVFSTVEFSGVRRGQLATLERDADHVRFWDIRQAIIESSHFLEETHRSRLSRLSWAAPSTILPWTAPVEPQPTTFDTTSSTDNAILVDTRRTKSFSRALLSFALIPSPQRHPMTTDVVVVNKDGDLELYAVHDVPKHPIWSSRGDLAIGAATVYQVIPGFHESEPPPLPWDITPPTHQEKPRTEKSSDRRGREKRSKHRSYSNSQDQPGFGRGDKDGFPALGSPRRESSLTATRHMKIRTYSPASIRRYPLDNSRSRDALAGASHGLQGEGGDGADARRSSGTPAARSIGEPRIDKHSKSRNPSKPLGRVAIGVLQDDISMIMRARASQGYSPANAIHNAHIVSNVPSDMTTLEDFWAWFHHSRQLLSSGSSRIHGFDFSFQGLWGLWEGLEPVSPRGNAESSDGTEYLSAPERPSTPLDPGLENTLPTPRPRHAHRRSLSPADGYHGDYVAALNSLNSRREVDRSAWKPAVHTNRLPHRRLALALCDWRIGDEEYHRWELEGKHAQVACWLLFANQKAKAIEVLMRSEDETHQMMSGTLAALMMQQSNSKDNELKDHYALLLVKIQDPHIRMMLCHIVFHDWSDVLDEESLPLRERLSIAFRFLDDKQLSAYLRRMAEDCGMRGRIEGLILTGLTPRGLDLLQSYVDTTGDIQTAAILACFVFPMRYQDPRAERWLEAYRDILDGWKLFYHRCQFDIEAGKMLQDAIQSGEVPAFEWVPRQILIRCTYCSKVVNSRRPLESGAEQRKRAAACPWCGRPLPRCSICLMSLSIVADSSRGGDLLHSSFRDTIDDAFVFCQNCRHGGHASHIIDWFYGEDNAERRTCPVAECTCYCDEVM